MDRARAFGSQLQERIKKINKMAPWARDIEVHWENHHSGQVKAQASALVNGGKVVVQKQDFSLEVTLDKLFAALRKKLVKSKKDRRHQNSVSSLSFVA